VRAFGLLTPLAGAIALLLVPLGAQAQETFVEEPDPTRLDVERLPPEAIEVTRDLYAHGFFLEAHLGARGFIGGVGDYAKAGPMAQISFGYELASWFWVSAAAELSLHGTDAPPPPSPTVFDVIDFLLQVRFQLNASARVALWLAGEVGIGFSTTDVLDTYGLDQADEVGFLYGGSLGFDWHMRNRHHSIGLQGGARVHSNLDGPSGDIAIGVHGTLYLRYVF
jgi:hypothetical protein